MKMVALDKLDERNGYLIDLGSSLDLFDRDTDDFLRGKRRWNDILNVWHAGKGRLRGKAWEKVASITGRHVQQAIEIMVTADNLAIDSAVLEGHYMFRQGEKWMSTEKILDESWASTQGILVAAEVPSATRQRVRSELAAFQDDLARIERANPELRRGGEFVDHWPTDWYKYTSESLLRALYYLHLSEVAEVHCFLSDAKRGFLKRVMRISKETGAVPEPHLVPDPHDEVKKAVLSELRNPDDLLPPITEIVLVHALDSGKSPGDALMDVRNSTEAREYRKELSRLRTGARAPTVGSRAEVEAYFRELRNLGGIWMKDPYERVVYDTVGAGKAVSVIPRVGGLLAHFLPSRAKEILGTFVTPPDSVHLFISRWFRTERQAEELIP